MKSISIIFTACLVSTTALAGPSISTGETMALPLDRCKSRAEGALRDAGFSGIKVLNYSVYAERGAYSAMVRCATDKQMVFYVVAGPRVERTSRYIDNISDSY